MPGGRGKKCAWTPATSSPSWPAREAHQGVVAIVRERQFLDLDDLLKGTKRDRTAAGARRGGRSRRIWGRLLRTAEGAGVDGVVVTERRSAPLSPVAVKASAGAAEHVKIARVVNLVRTLEELKQRDLWIIGLDERGTMNYDQFDFSVGCVLVLGREGAGLHDLVKPHLRSPFAHTYGREGGLSERQRRRRRGACTRPRGNAAMLRWVHTSSAFTGAGEEAEGFGFMKYLWFAAVCQLGCWLGSATGRKR